MHRYMLLLCLLSTFALASGPTTEAMFNAAVRACGQDGFAEGSLAKFDCVEKRLAAAARSPTGATHKAADTEDEDAAQACRQKHLIGGDYHDCVVDEKRSAAKKAAKVEAAVSDPTYQPVAPRR